MKTKKYFDNINSKEPENKDYFGDLGEKETKEKIESYNKKVLKMLEEHQSGKSR